MKIYVFISAIGQMKQNYHLQVGLFCTEYGWTISSVPLSHAVISIVLYTVVFC